MPLTFRKVSRSLVLAAGSAVLAASAIGAASPPRGAALESAERANPRVKRMSEMGARAAAEIARLERQRTGKSGKAAGRLAALTGAAPDDAPAARDPRDDDECQNNPRCGRGFRDGPRGGQAELSIAIDSTGQHIVVGFNDQRGFLLNPISVSGFMYSDDGGTTFTDGGPTSGARPGCERPAAGLRRSRGQVSWWLHLHLLVDPDCGERGFGFRRRADNGCAPLDRLWAHLARAI